MTLRRTAAIVLASLALAACNASEEATPTSSTSHASSAPTAAPTAAKTPDSASAPVDDPFTSLPTFKDAGALATAPGLKGKWMPNETEQCGPARQEPYTFRDEALGDIYKGTTMTCWLDETSEQVDIYVFDDKEFASFVLCGDDVTTCFSGYGWAISASNEYALADVLEAIGVDLEEWHA